MKACYEARVVTGVRRTEEFISCRRQIFNTFLSSQHAGRLKQEGGKFAFYLGNFVRAGLKVKH